ncbi:MAG: hypothetical protein AB1704_14630 [Pseudomonadota bacterium]|uniref:hypothetical protein n=2 Tax=Burkholderiales TaxID=80840 RepID=UPI0010F48BA7|nr:hypothetical protein [Burkholderia sp. 4M9327F10]
MSNLKPRLLHLSAACALTCVQMLAHAASSQEVPAANAASQTQTSQAAALLAQRPIVGDDAGAVRDTLATGRIHASSPTLTERLRDLIPTRQVPHDLDLAKVNLDRELVFVVPVSYGVLYRSKNHSLTVNADLADEEAPGVIPLKKTVIGPSGRGLVVAAEAKAKGYIQRIDLIELKPGESSKTKVRAHLSLSPADFAKVDGDFAIALMCDLAPPYLSEQREHSDPTDDEPTDITTRTSVLYTHVRAVWLISPQTGTVLAKNLHLSN